MSKPRIGTVPDDAHHAQQDSPEPLGGEYQTVEAPRNEMNINLQKATILKPCIVAPNAAHGNFTPISSFCRRRNGPVLGKLPFPQAIPRTITISNPSDNSGSCGAGVVLDLQVTDSDSRRLGSDGTEKAESDGSSDPSPINDDSTIDPNVASATEALFRRKAFDLNDFPPTTVNLSIPELQSNANIRITIDHEHLTDPSHVCALGDVCDVEMMDTDLNSACLDVSPPSPTSAFLAEKRSCLSPLPSKPDRLLSRKTRSPKIVRKSWRPPYDLLASRAGKQSSYTSCQAPMPFRCRNLERIAAENSELSLPVTKQCESPSVVGISSLSIHSPGIAIQKDPLEVVGKSCLLSQVSQNSLASSSDSSTSTEATASCKMGSNEAFRLVSSSELKPKWRRHLTKTGAPEVSTENTATTSTTILNHRSIVILT